jgi:putative endonuclease
MTNYTNSVIYCGVTSNLPWRVFQHREKLVEGFTKKYNVNKLVYFEEVGSAYEAISREKQIKAGSRKKKIQLIESLNPDWRDLFDDITR